jgi:ribosomal-protein-alanine N-acetyltransferase
VSVLLLPIRGNRVLIRCLEEGDLEGLYALDTDAEVKRYVGGAVPHTKEAFFSRVRTTLGPQTCLLAIGLIGNENFVGRASFAKTFIITSTGVHTEWEISVLIAQKFWGNRFGQEVVSELTTAAFMLSEVPSVVAVVHPDNTASRNLMDKLGFKLDGLKYSPQLCDHEHMIFRLPRPIEWTPPAAPATPPHSSHG